MPVHLACQTYKLTTLTHDYLVQLQCEKGKDSLGGAFDVSGDHSQGPGQWGVTKTWAGGHSLWCGELQQRPPDNGNSRGGTCREGTSNTISSVTLREQELCQGCGGKEA
eukprot:1154274-Pelagomonas_calceolata.AAC.1